MMSNFEKLRAGMVERQLRARGVTDKDVLKAMGSVPREEFVPEELRASSYDDGPLPIGEGQTISQPLIVAEMIEAARISPGARVLEVGSGSGYAAAVLSRIASEVFAIERIAPLVVRAKAALQRIGVSNVTMKAGDGALGWPEAAPYDAIIVSAAGREIPHALKDQLKVGGALIMPVGLPGLQQLKRISRLAEDRFETEKLGPVAFVPLIAGEERRP